MSNEFELQRMIDKNLSVPTQNAAGEKPDGAHEEQCQDFLDQVDSMKDPNLTKCGFGFWRPTWLQILASKKSYILVHSLFGLVDASASSNYDGSISTIEKRFKLPSTSMGIISSIRNVSTVVTAMLLAYFSTNCHKTRWIAGGGVVVAISCFLRYLPHYMFGPGDTSTILDTLNNPMDENLCKHNYSSIEENCSFNSEGRVTFYIFIVAQILLGIGASPYYSMARAYLDDNIKKDTFPFVLGCIEALYYVGPALGLLTASFTLSYYINPLVTPSFTADDPRWIGAWYLAWVPFGFIYLLLAFSFALFPRILPREAARRKASNNLIIMETQRSFKDFKEALARLAKNSVFVFNTASRMVYIIATYGYWVFLPKYIETQFGKTASEANLITGIFYLVCISSGVALAGIIISKFKPNSKILATWSIITETIEMLGYIYFISLTCLRNDFHESSDANGSWDVLAECNAACNCSSLLTYSPVCSSDQSRTFFSPCHAGCTTSFLKNGTEIFGDCNCIGGTRQATDGPCPSHCANEYFTFIVIFAVMKIFASTGEHANTILQYRAVNPDDKSISIALYEGVMSEMGYIPAPLIYGIALDNSCLIWKENCGQIGNCWIYDSQRMAFLQNFTAAGTVFVAILLDVIVLLKVGKMSLYGAPEGPVQTYNSNVT